MQFKPFWDQLADLGIELPEPYKIRAKETPIAGPTPSGPARWYKSGETALIGGYEIPGMVYIGTELPAVEYYRGTEPALINPTAYINSRNLHVKSNNTPYNPSYHKLNGEQRAVYLNWHATGRSNPEVATPYVALFIYGLERRIFNDLINEPRSEERDRELQEIATELERLQALYKPKERLHYYGNSLQEALGQCLKIVRLVLSPTNIPQLDPFKANDGDLRLLVGQTVAQGRPLSALLALAYGWTVMGLGVPSVAQQFPQIFRQLFEQRYYQRFGQGLTIKPGKMKLRLSYTPINGSFGNRTQYLSIADIPDISRQTGQLQVIGELLRESRYSLDSYSRYISQNPKDSESPKALGYLPVEALQNWKGAGIDRVKTWLSKYFTSPKVRHQIILAKEILPIWTGKTGPHITKSELKSMGNLLEALGYGLEPDGRQVQIDVPADTQIVLYRLGADRPTEPSKKYQAAALLVHMALAVSSGESPASDLEKQAILSHIPTLPGLSPTEQAKLIAHLYYLQTPTLNRLSTRMEALTGDKSEFGQFLIAIATTDGPPSPAEIKQLEKAYKLLSLESQSLYSDIHNLGSTQPTAKTTTKTTTKTKANKLDMATVQAKIAESQEISTLLADIFTEEPPTPTKTKTKTPAKSTAKTYANLDPKHSALLEHLSQADQWERSDLLPIAESLGLLLDGALEVINEAAFDLCDEPVLEGHDSIEIDRTVMEQLLA